MWSVRFPKNGWALSGLVQAYRDAHQTDKANEAEARFKDAWAHADVTLSGSIVK